MITNTQNSHAFHIFYNAKQSIDHNWNIKYYERLRNHYSGTLLIRQKNITETLSATKV